MKEELKKIKEYFFVSYTKDEITEFAKLGDFPQEFLVKRRRVRILIMIIVTIGFIISLIVS